MPGYDRSGPSGRGAMTGRGEGRCGGNRVKQFARHYGRGRGYRHFINDLDERQIADSGHFDLKDVENIVADISDLVNRLGKFLSQYFHKTNSVK